MTDNAAASSVPAGLWAVRLGAIIWFLLIVGCLMALPVMLDATWLLVAAAVVLALLAGALWAFLRRLISSRHGRFGHDWLKGGLAAFFVLCIAIAAPIYYIAVKTETDPALLPRAVLTNGEKTVVYQGMMHIGTERFYKQVVYDAEKALSDGYVLYYEGVQPNPEGDKWFADNLAGGGDLSDNYRKLGEMCGLQFQLGYFDLLEKDKAVHPQSHVTADVDTLQMKQEYDRLMASDPEFAAAFQAEQAAQSNAGGDMAGAMGFLDNLTEGQKKLSGYVCRFMMSRVAKGNGEARQIDKVILDFRNRKLAERILADPHDKIYITYGAHHLEGILPLLQQADPRWRVESVSWIRPVEAPEQFEASL
ncbi:hypothetical protein ABUE31_02365 [Mesorhizobium sp. ZMM04-5]|uniref:TraB/GumN family protein n=1 Tax=Mesorhizobium marinum TaxID=3228790 RepID=A0ABV3QUS5_9HYPH